MKKMDVNERLKRVKEKASLSISDLSIFCEINKGTMRTWVHGTPPSFNRVLLLEAALDVLDEATREKLFPVPLYVNQFNRADYIRDAKDAIVRRVRGQCFTSPKSRLRNFHKLKKGD